MFKVVHPENTRKGMALVYFVLCRQTEKRVGIAKTRSVCWSNPTVTPSSVSTLDLEKEASSVCLMLMAASRKRMVEYEASLKLVVSRLCWITMTYIGIRLHVRARGLVSDVKLQTK